MSETGTDAGNVKGAVAILEGKLEEGLRHGSDLLSEPGVEGLLLLVPGEELDALAGQRGPKLDVKGQGSVIVAALNELGEADRFLYQSGGGGSARWALVQGVRQEGLMEAVRALVHVQRSEQVVGRSRGSTRVPRSARSHARR